MSGSEVETYTSHAQVWPRDAIEKKKNKEKKTIQKPHQKPHRLFFFFFLENNSSYSALMSTLRCVYFSQLIVERVLLPLEVEICTVE